MRRISITVSVLLLTGGPALAADVMNMDAESQTISVMEGASTTHITLAPGEHVDVCHDGCFILFPDGGQMALSGMESVEIKDGAGQLQ